MNIFLNEYFRCSFELNHFSARFNEKMNFQNVSPTPICHCYIKGREGNSDDFGNAVKLVGEMSKSVIQRCGQFLCFLDLNYFFHFNTSALSNIKINSYF